jgi:AcrR family transcriptional regulator
MTQPQHEAAIRDATVQGRPRDSSIDARTTEAVLTLLGRAPYSALTMEGVAVAAGTSKPALRRRWKSLPGIVVHTLIQVLGTEPTPDTGCVFCDLVTGMSNLADTLAQSVVTSALPGLISDLARDPELRELFLHDYFEARRSTTRSVLQHAIDRGEIQQDIDMELTLDLLAAPLYYRGFFGHQPIDSGLAERIVQSVLSGIATAEWAHPHGVG